MSLWPEIRAQLNGLKYSPAGVMIAVDGTAYPGAPVPPSPLLNDGTGFWSGFASGVCGGVTNVQDGLWECVEIGYPAATYPMWPSIQIGIANLVAAIQAYPVGTPMILSGYSQGAIVTDQVWTQYCLPEGGVLHDRYVNGDFLRIYNFGDPFRCPGVAYGNTLLWGQSVPGDKDGQTTGGIGGALDLTYAQTNVLSSDGKPVVMSFDNPGDLYGSAPCGAEPWVALPNVESVEYIFFKIVMYGQASDYLDLAELVFKPIGDIEAAINAGTFFAEGTASPHYQYYDAMLAAISDALAVGNALPHQSGT